MKISVQTESHYTSDLDNKRKEVMENIFANADKSVALLTVCVGTKIELASYLWANVRSALRSIPELSKPNLQDKISAMEKMFYDVYGRRDYIDAASQNRVYEIGETANDMINQDMQSAIEAISEYLDENNVDYPYLHAYMYLINHLILKACEAYDESRADAINMYDMDVAKILPTFTPEKLLRVWDPIYTYICKTLKIHRKRLFEKLEIEKHEMCKPLIMAINNKIFDSKWLLEAYNKTMEKYDNE